jgi:hypothetical protein
MGESTTGPRSAFDEVRVAFEPLRAGLELRGHELEGAQGVLRVLITVALGELLEGERHHQPAERVAGRGSTPRRRRAGYTDPKPFDP